MDENLKLERKKKITDIGMRYAIFAFVEIVLQCGLAAVLELAAKDFMEKNHGNVSLMIVVLAVDIIGLPLVWILTRKLDKIELEKRKFGVKNFITGFFIIVFLLVAGAMVGFALNMLFTVPFGVNPMEAVNASKIVMSSNPLLRLAVVGIMAPIVEELIFRKMLIDHFGKYGKHVGIVTSGIMFGMFHGNFSQAIFAMLIGFAFAYIYTKTGNIIYTIVYHIIINSSNMLIALPLALKCTEAANNPELMDAVAAGDENAMISVGFNAVLLLAYIALVFIFAIVGLILLIANRKKIKIDECENESYGTKEAVKTVLTNPGILVFLGMCLIIFLQNYLLPILGINF